MVDAPTPYRGDAVNRLILLILLLPVAWAFEIPPTERAFRFLVVDDNGKPAEGTPLKWIASIENGVNQYGGRTSKEVMRKILLSDSNGVVDIPKHQFSFLNIGFPTQELKQSTDWMVDSKTSSQFLTWDVYRKENPEMYALGPPTPGFDAVFKVLSKKGISNLIRYNVNHKQVPCDGTPTPLRVLGGPSAEVKNPADADVVITIKRPDQDLKPKDAPGVGLVLPQRVPWILQGKTLKFAHFSADTNPSADFRIRTWTDRIEVEPSNVDTSYGTHDVTLWVLMPGDTPMVFPMRCSINASFESRKLGRLVYEVNFQVCLPMTLGTRFHPDVCQWESWGSLASELSPTAIAPKVDPIRSKNFTHAFPTDLTTVPRLRYDTFPIPPGKERMPDAPPVLLPSDKP